MLKTVRYLPDSESLIEVRDAPGEDENESDDLVIWLKQFPNFFDSEETSIISLICLCN
jgi:hypothetical protein